MVHAKNAEEFAEFAKKIKMNLYWFFVLVGMGYF